MSHFSVRAHAHAHYDIARAFFGIQIFFKKIVDNGFVKLLY